MHFFKRLNASHHFKCAIEAAVNGSPRQQRVLDAVVAGVPCVDNFLNPPLIVENNREKLRQRRRLV